LGNLRGSPGLLRALVQTPTSRECDTHGAWAFRLGGSLVLTVALDGRSPARHWQGVRVGDLGILEGNEGPEGSIQSLIVPPIPQFPCIFYLSLGARFPDRHRLYGSWVPLSEFRQRRPLSRTLGQQKMFLIQGDRGIIGHIQIAFVDKGTARFCDTFSLNAIATEHDAALVLPSLALLCGSGAAWTRLRSAVVARSEPRRLGRGYP